MSYQEKGYMRLSILFISKYFYVEKLQPYLHIYIPTYIQDTIYMIPTKYITVDPRHKSKNVKKIKHHSIKQHKSTYHRIILNNTILNISRKIDKNMIILKKKYKKRQDNKNKNNTRLSTANQK